MNIAIAIGSRANFGSLRSAMLAIRKRGADVVPALFASALSDRFGDVRGSLERDGFMDIDCVRLSGMLDPVNMADTAGMAASAWSRWLGEERPDAVLVCGDRHECLGAAMAAAYAGVRLVHTMGGETSGNIDDKVRDAITALADEHCVATEGAATRVALLLGHESPRAQWLAPNIHITGCPRIDTCREAIGDELRRAFAPFIMVSQHPVTTRTEQENEADMAATLQAVEIVASEQSLAVELFWPNADDGTEGTQRAIRRWLNSEAAERLTVRTHRAMGPHDYARMMAATKCLVGNSSSGLRDGAWIGTPCVNVGERQRGREHGANVQNVSTTGLSIDDEIRNGTVEGRIAEMVAHQIDHGPYPSNPLYGDGTAGEKVADVILGVNERERVAKINEMVRRM
jgi:UDP-hydrolysing UDP-N-acetyl-D-glucosamine 2-epimerase